MFGVLSIIEHVLDIYDFISKVPAQLKTLRNILKDDLNVEGTSSNQKGEVMPRLGTLNFSLRQKHEQWRCKVNNMGDEKRNQSNY